MSSGTAPPKQTPGDQQPLASPSPSELLIDDRLRQTRRQVATVELTDGLITLAAGSLAYLLLAALVDHWLVPGGVGFAGRLAMFLVLVAGAGVFFVRKILPLLARRIHPLFAAQTIEESRPGMKNSLVNLLFLRQEGNRSGGDRLAQHVYQGLQQKTADDLAELDVQTTVDRAAAIRHGYVLVGVLAVLGLYLLLSPKSPLVSISRVVWPWGDVPPPTRVAIRNIKPGDATAIQGDTMTVSAEINGLKTGEPALVYYTTADGQSVNQAVPLAVPDGDYRYQGRVPPGEAGMQQDMTYYLAAGDARSRTFTVRVESALAITVDQLRYHYPDYTGLADRTTQGEGDVKALEGTQVTVHATANQPIGQAVMQMDCDPRRGIRMSTQGTTATGQLRLAMQRDDPRKPEYESYQITDSEAPDAGRPVRYSIDVIRDEPPTVQFVDAPADHVDLPLDGLLELKVRAEDPDFALRRVAIRAVRDGRSLLLSPPFLLDKVRPEKGLEGPFEGSYRFEPAKLELKVGDDVEYWAEAYDNREDKKGPTPNRSETLHRTITIVASDSAQPPDGSAPKQPGQQSARKPGDQGSPPERPDETQPNRGQGQGDQPPDQQPQDGRQPANQDQQHPADAPKASADQPQKDAGAQDSGEDKKPSDQQPSGQQKSGEQDGQADAANQQGGKSGQEKPGENTQPQPGQQGQGQDNAGQSAQPQSGQDKGGQSAQQPSGQGGQPQGDQQSEGQGTQSGAQPKSDQPSNQGQPSEKGQSSGGPGQNAQPSREPIDGPTNPGDAFEQVLEYKREKEQGKDPSGGAGQSGQPEAGKQSGDTPAQGPRQDQAGTPTSNQPSGSQGPSKPGEAQGGKPSADTQSPAQLGQPSGQQPTPAGQQPNAPGQQSNAATQQPNAPEQQPSPPQPQAGTRSDGTGQKSPSPDAAAGQPQPQRTGDNEQAGSPPDSAQQPPGDGQGVQSKGPGEPLQEKPPGTAQPTPNAAAKQGGDPSQSKGQAGAGRPSTDTHGSPSPGEANQSHDKMAGQPDQSPSNDQNQADSPSVSPKQSDSQGDTAGDRSGGGQKGGGQKSNQEGTGTAGTHTAAEQGSSRSNQQGEGETGTKAGNQAMADHATGQSDGQRRGPGSATRKQPGGQGAESRPQNDQTAASGDQSRSDQPGSGDAPMQNPKAQGPAGSGNPTMGGAPGDQPPPPPSQEQGPLGADQVNLDYARKQTSLALDYLEDQLAQDKPDRELLDRLGWTRDDLEAFVDRWKQMRQAAQQQGQKGSAAKRELDEAIKSLGLRPRATELRGGQSAPDDVRRLKGSGRFEPPAKWKELFEAYNRSISSPPE